MVKTDKPDWHRLLHTLWTKAVGTDGYIKREWLDLENTCWRLHRERAESDLLALVRRVVTGDGQQLENLDMTEDEWKESAGVTDNIEVTISRADWFAMIRAVGGKVT